MLKNLRRKLNSDKGDSTLVSTILVIPLILGILITMIDVAVYFADRGQILNITRDGARQVAIFGGDGTATAATPLEVAYGQSRSSVCAGVESMPMVSEAFNSGTTTAIECSVLRNIANTAGLISVRVTSVQCGAATSAGDFTVNKTNNIGQQVGCEVHWAYDSIPGSGLSFLQRARSLGYAQDGLKDMDHVTKVNTTSEVNLNGIPLQNW